MKKLKLLLLAGQLTFSLLDSRATRHVVTTGGVEYNPLGKPFVHSRALYFTNTASSFGVFLVAKKLERKHPKLSLFLQGADLAGHAAGFGYTAVQVKPK